MNDLFQSLDNQEIFALAFFCACWIGYGIYAKQDIRKDKSLLAVTNRYRYQWMCEMITRENRSVDAIMIGNLMRSITFTANTTIFIIAGLLGMLSYHSEIGHIISAVPYAKPLTPALWEIKILVLLLIFIYAYFKYTWSLRQHNYSSIFVAAAPEYTRTDFDREALARKGAFLASNAAEHFNHGQRAYYFGMAVLAWFVHPYLFILATAFIVFVLHRREFRSATLKNLDK
jgi:uncharacterized membrane protein